MPHNKSPETAGNAVSGQREVYFEFQKIGQAVRVTAIDAVSGLEVVIQGPANAPQSQLQRIALQKLKMRLAKSE